MARKPSVSRPRALIDHAAQKSEAIDRALEAALAEIRANPGQPATQDNVARLANCSRGTVNNRTTVLDALHDIKKARREFKVVHKNAGARDSERELEKLKKQLAKSRDEVLEMLNQRDDIKRKYEKLQDNFALFADSVRSRDAKHSEKRVRPLTVEPLGPPRKGR